MGRKPQKRGRKVKGNFKVGTPTGKAMLHSMEDPMMQPGKPKLELVRPKTRGRGKRGC